VGGAAGEGASGYSDAESFQDMEQYHADYGSSSGGGTASSSGSALPAPPASAQQQSQRPKPMIGPSEPGAKPAAIRLASSSTSTAANPAIRNDGTKWAGTMYNYQVVDSKGYVIRDDLNIVEEFTKTANTTVSPNASSWQQIGGQSWGDFIGCRLPCSSNSEILQNFTVWSIHGTDVPARISSQNLLNIHSDSTGDAAGTSTPVIP
jgi:hypothetical protein